MSIINENLIYPNNIYEFIDESSDEDIIKYLDNWGRTKHEKDRWTCLKYTTKYTSYTLYNRNLNPVNVYIDKASTYNYDKKKWEYPENLYRLTASIASIDDSSYTIRLNCKERKELETLRDCIMKWVSEQKFLDGDEFINKCVELGFDTETIDYN